MMVDREVPTTNTEADKGGEEAVKEVRLYGQERK